jgi:uncharacterized protein
MKVFLILLLLGSLSHPEAMGQAHSGEPVPGRPVHTFPQPTGFVNDFEGILEPDQEKKLNDAIIKFANRTTNQIAVVTIASIAPYDNIKAYTTDLGNAWGVGQKEKNNGVVIVVSKKLKQVWIGTGLGAEKILTDLICKRISDDKMLPAFKQGDFFGGLEHGLQELIRSWQ